MRMLLVPYAKRTKLITTPFTLVVPTDQERRMDTTCFRVGQCRAGNFRQWQTVTQVILDPNIERLFLEEVQAILVTAQAITRVGSTWSFTITHPKTWVGWVSTVPRRHLPTGTEIKKFSPNRRTTAWMVADKNLEAPRTGDMTFVCETNRDEDGRWKVIVHSMYPGQDVPLGNWRKSRTISPDEAVFFPWENPGA